MPKTINPIKQSRVTKALKEGKSARQALREGGYKENSIHHSTDMGVVKRGMDIIMTELKEQDVNIELVIHNLNQDRNLAQAKGDIATMTRVDELLGKYLAMFKDVSRSKVDMDISDERRKEIELLVSRYNRQPLSSQA